MDHARDVNDDVEPLIAQPLGERSNRRIGGDVGARLDPDATRAERRRIPKARGDHPLASLMKLNAQSFADSRSAPVTRSVFILGSSKLPIRILTTLESMGMYSSGTLSLSDFARRSDLPPPPRKRF